MTEDLSQLIADIEDLSDPELEARSGAKQKNWERMLSDKVLLACTRWRKHLEVWIDPEGRQQTDRPSPLTNLEDAKLAVPEGCNWGIGSRRKGLPHSRSYAYATVTSDESRFHEETDTDARALALAGLKARLAMEKADD